MTIIRRLQYELDNLFARGTGTLLFALAGAVLILIVILTLLMLIAQVSPGPGASVLDELWTVFIYVFDPSGVPFDAGGWAYRLILLTASLGGVFVLSMLVGILTNGFAETVLRLRKGKSIVVESHHTLILGWGEEIFAVVEQLIEASSNLKYACIVILADRDKVEMQEAIRARIVIPKNTRIIVRSGSPLEVADLSIVRPEHARCIILLDSHIQDNEISDALTIKTLLALSKVLPVNEGPNVVAAMRSEETLRVAKLIMNDRIELVCGEAVIAQMIAQTSRQRGLSAVYSELLRFEGSEFYIVSADPVVGEKFSDVQMRLQSCSLVGIIDGEQRIEFAPSPERQIQPGDHCIVISEDDGHSTFAAVPISIESVQENSLSQMETQPNSPPERILILGWNVHGTLIIRELQQYIAQNSLITVASLAAVGNSMQQLESNRGDVTYQWVAAEPTRRADLESLSVETYDSIIVLAAELADAQRSDAQTITTLLHVRDILEQNSPIGKSRAVVVAEMLDERNSSLVSTDQGDEFIISSKIISLLLTQIAENRQLGAVYAELLSSHGNEVYLKPATQYVVAGTTLQYGALVTLAAQQRHAAFGMRIWHNGSWNLRLAIPKTENINVSEFDQLIVIAAA